MPMRLSESGFVIRISQDGKRALYVRGQRKKLRVFERMSFALDTVKELRPSFSVGQFAAVVPIDAVPYEERR